MIRGKIRLLDVESGAWHVYDAEFLSREQAEVFRAMLDSIKFIMIARKIKLSEIIEVEI